MKIRQTFFPERGACATMELYRFPVLLLHHGNVDRSGWFRPTTDLYSTFCYVAVVPSRWNYRQPNVRLHHRKFLHPFKESFLQSVVVSIWDVFIVCDAVLRLSPWPFESSQWSCKYHKDAASFFGFPCFGIPFITSHISSIFVGYQSLVR